ncbi:hypothetical protein H0H81_009801 [Sphagnurus paluster]|uniref:Uncharacterized protein n=1 Tax=Sphagnurus paluster TaxID=117069 RepID=A0A9P7GI97_9AGAR|nr:hypothetical protein H0H81_009801 [Sphagnurus paluster]
MPDLLSTILPLLYLSLAPLVTVTHLLVGQAVLHHAYPHSPAWTSSLLATGSAGATGGIILGLPLVPLFIHLFVRALERLKQPRGHALRKDESVDPRRSLELLMSRAEWAACAAIVLSGVPAAGALGVVCLYGSGSGLRNVLSPAGAAVAGVVGGAVVWGCVFGFLVLVLVASDGFVDFGAYRIRGESQRYVSQEDVVESKSPGSIMLK